MSSSLCFPSSGVLQQRQTVAAGDRPLRQRERQQAASRQQVRPHNEEGCGLHHSEGKTTSQSRDTVSQEYWIFVCAVLQQFDRLSEANRIMK